MNMTTIKDRDLGKSLIVLFFLPLLVVYVCSWGWIVCTGQEQSWEIYLVGPAKMAYFWVIWLSPATGLNVSPLAWVLTVFGIFFIGLWRRKSSLGISVAALMIVLQFLTVGAAVLLMGAVMHHGL